MWLSPLVALAVANAVLLGSMIAGSGLPGSGLIGAFAGDAHLDYGLGALRGLTRLTDAFVERVLGPDSHRVVGSGPTSVGSGGGRSGAPRLSAGQARIERSHSFTNDEFDQAYVVPSVPFTARTDTRDAHREANEPATCAATGSTAWYRYNPSNTATLFADTFGSSYATVLGVFTGSEIGRLQNRGCSATSASGNAQLGFPAQAGTTYFFQITGPLGGGSLVFDLAPIGRTDRVSISSSGREANGASSTPSLSADGRYVAFASSATNLIAGQATGCANCAQIFVRDRVTGATTLESVSSSGAPGDMVSRTPALSESGRYLVFSSPSTNLRAGPVPPATQIYVRDRLRQTTERVSTTSTGVPGDGDSTTPSVSADGRYVLFTSSASNLRPDGGIPCGSVCVNQPGTPTGTQQQIYLHDRDSGTTSLVSGAGSTAPNGFATNGAISSDGRNAVFASTSSNLAGPTGNITQVFVRDLPSGKIAMVSRSTTGAPGDRGSLYPVTLSRDGRYAAFLSDATNLVSGDTNGAVDAFVRDLVTGSTTRVSVSSSGEQADRPSDTNLQTCHCGPGDVLAPITYSVAVSSDGRFVTFNSLSTNLVANDTNGVSDVFVHDLVTGATTRVSVNSEGSEGLGPSTAPSISGDGQVVAFASSASNLVDGDNNQVDDVFVHENELAQ
jgi:Tol biopolymer transport system component